MNAGEHASRVDDIAQTNVDLLAQMERRGYPETDRIRIQRTYELMFKLTSCLYRSSGRSVLEHLLGVTSVVVGINGSTDWVTATLAHATYLHGDSGGLRKRVTPARRAMMVALIGSAAEEILQHYTALSWSESTIPALRAALPAMNQGQREAIGIRIADQVDLYGTREVLYCANVERRLEFARNNGSSVVALAGALGLPTLAHALEQAYADTLAHVVAPALTTPRWRDRVILPRSYRTRPTIKLYRAARSQIWRTFGR